MLEKEIKEIVIRALETISIEGQDGLPLGLDDPEILEYAELITKEILALLPKGDEEGLLTEEEQDKCVATEEQLEKYLAEPDDEVASSLNISDKRLVAKCILYGINIMNAQKALDDINKEKEIGEILNDVSSLVPQWLRDKLAKQIANLPPKGDGEGVAP